MTEILNMFIIFINNISTASDDMSNTRSNENKLLPKNFNSKMDEEQDSLMRQFSALDIGFNEVNIESTGIESNKFPIGVWDGNCEIPDFKNTCVNYIENQVIRNINTISPDTRPSSNIGGARTRTQGFKQRYSKKGKVTNKELRSETSFLNDSYSSPYGIRTSKDNGNETKRHEKNFIMKERQPMQWYFPQKEEGNKRIDNTFETNSFQIWKGARPKTRIHDSKHERNYVFTQPENPGISKPFCNIDDQLYIQSHKHSPSAKERYENTDINTKSNSLFPQRETFFGESYSTKSESQTDFPTHKIHHHIPNTMTSHSQSPDELYNVNPNTHSSDIRCFRSPYTHPTYREPDHMYSYYPEEKVTYPNPEPFLTNKQIPYDSVGYTNDMVHSYCNNIQKNNYLKNQYHDVSGSTFNSYLNPNVEEKQNTYPSTKNEDSMMNLMKERSHCHSNYNESRIRDAPADELDNKSLNTTTKFEISHTMADILENPFYKDIHEERISSETNKRLVAETKRVIEEFKEKTKFNRDSLKFRNELKQQIYEKIEKINHILKHERNVRKLKDCDPLFELISDLIETIADLVEYISNCEIVKNNFYYEVNKNLGDFDLYNNQEFSKLVKENEDLIKSIIVICLDLKREIIECFNKLKLRKVYNFFE